MSEGVVVVTGGGTGIGFGVARAIVKGGRAVVLAGRRREVLEEAARELGERAAAVVHDVDDHAAASGFVDQVEREHGPIAALVNNAGRHHKAPALDHSVEDFAAVVHTNLVAPFALSQAAARRMASRKKGTIVMIASITTRVGMPMVPAYAASKAGIAGLGRALATEWGPLGIRVNVVCPGFVDSAMFRRATETDPARLAKIRGRIGLDRLGEAEEIGSVVRFLCSDDAAYVTGETIAVDGGFSSGF
jgi:NAD(P)-dependent dehydrogenase (short-subunit alcohol dehydrogenase family)